MKSSAVVDHGSDDDVIDRILDLVDAGQIRLVRPRRNRGKGAAARTGLGLASGDLTTVLDCDLEYDPAHLCDMLVPLPVSEARVVHGTRPSDAPRTGEAWPPKGTEESNHSIGCDGRDDGEKRRHHVP